MIKNLRLNPLLYGFIPFLSYNKTNNQQNKYNVEKLWPDHKKCSQDNLFKANKISSDEYIKLKTHCKDSLLNFQKKCDDEIKSKFKKSTMTDIYKLNGKVPNEQYIYDIIERELDKIYISSDIDAFEKILIFLNYNGIQQKIKRDFEKFYDMIDKKLEKIFISNDINSCKKLLEFIKNNSLKKKIKFNFEKFIKINNLNDSYSYFIILLENNCVSVDIYKNHFANLLKREMELNCKQGKQISVEKYKKKYSLLSAIVELVYCEVAAKNIQCCDLKELLQQSNKLAKQKVDQLLIDALLKDDIFTVIDLINEHRDKLNLSVLSKKMTNKYLIDYLLNNVANCPSIVEFTTGEMHNKIIRIDASNCCNSYEAISLLLFMSCYFENNILTDCIINYKDLHGYFNGQYFKRHCQNAIKYSYQNDDYDLFVKYSNMLKKFSNYKDFFAGIQIIHEKSFEQKNNFLELIETHKIIAPVITQKELKNQHKIQHTVQIKKPHNYKNNSNKKYSNEHNCYTFDTKKKIRKS